MLMEKGQINPQVMLETLFEKVEQLTREGVMKDAYIKQLEAELDKLRQAQEVA
jgi:hypothetical protein